MRSMYGKRIKDFNHCQSACFAYRLMYGHTALLGTYPWYRNVPSSDVTWLHKISDVCVKCSVIFAILGNLCFLRINAIEEIGVSWMCYDYQPTPYGGTTASDHPLVQWGIWGTMNGVLSNSLTMQHVWSAQWCHYARSTQWPCHYALNTQWQSYYAWSTRKCYYVAWSCT